MLLQIMLHTAKPEQGEVSWRVVQDKEFPAHISRIFCLFIDRECFAGFFDLSGEV
jgi:hypothetical protein